MVSSLAYLGSALAPWCTLEFKAGCTIIVVENSDYGEVDREAPIVDSTFRRKLTRHLLLRRLCPACPLCTSSFTTLCSLEARRQPFSTI